jgi:hypothetical protein
MNLPDYWEHHAELFHLWLTVSHRIPEEYSRGMAGNDRFTQQFKGKNPGTVRTEREDAYMVHS